MKIMKILKTLKTLLQPGPALRISIGLISLVVSLILAFDALVNILPDERQQQAELRKELGYVIGRQMADMLAAGDMHGVQERIDQLVGSTPQLLSVGIRRPDGLVAASKDHERKWLRDWTGEATPTHVVIAMLEGKTFWGDVELLFADASSPSIAHWLRRPSIALVLLLSTLGLACVYLYLKRVLHHLDPSQAVPQRVRKAFDTLTEAVLILDQKGRVMLANDAFAQLNRGNPDRVEGKPVTDVAWLRDGLPRPPGAHAYPWEDVIRSGRTVQGMELKVTLPAGASHQLRMNCSAISDGSGMARGCLLSFDDVTELRAANALLQDALHDLELSRDQIQRQNEELQKHAHFDYLTGCLNRRAFFARAEQLYRNAVANRTALICLMADIDHFKSFNDRYGHAVGDLVIQQVAAALGRSLRTQDLLCRYGGEEFCILLENTDEDTAMEVAERIRSSIENECGPGVRTIEGLRVTASLGLAVLAGDGKRETLAQLIERADAALYASKKSGRNRVTRAQAEVVAG